MSWARCLCSPAPPPLPSPSSRTPSAYCRLGCNAAACRFHLGHLLHYGRELNATDQVIGVMLVIVVIGLLADKVPFVPSERFLHRRWEAALNLTQLGQSAPQHSLGSRR